MNAIKRILRTRLSERNYQRVSNVHRRTVVPVRRELAKLIKLPGRVSMILRFRLRGDSYVPRIGLSTVFIARENVLFLEEWILYHRSLGVDYFYLYDNSAVEVTKDSHAEAGANVGKIAKRNVQYHRFVTITDCEIQEEMARLQREIPGVYVHEWSPRDEHGKVWYGKNESQQHAIENHRAQVDWMIFLDVDEFLVPSENLADLCAGMLRRGYGGGSFIEHQMDSRWNHLGRRVSDIDLEFPHYRWFDYKIICYLPRVTHTETHQFKSKSPQVRFKHNTLHYRHYKYHGRNPSLLVKTDPLDFNDGRCHEWKLRHVSPDWQEIMISTRTDDPLVNSRINVAKIYWGTE